MLEDIKNLKKKLNARVVGEIIFLLISISVNLVFSQNNDLLSTNNIIQKIRRADSIALIYENRDQDLSIIYRLKSLNLSKELRNDSIVAKKYQDLSKSYRIKNDYKTALEYLDFSIAYYEKGLDTTGLIQSIRLKSLYYNDLGETGKAYLFLNKAYELTNLSNSSKIIKFSLYREIGNFHVRVEDYEKAIKFYDQCLEIVKNNVENNDSKEIDKWLIRELSIKINLAVVYRKTENYENSFRNYKDILKSIDSISIEPSEEIFKIKAISKANLGYLYFLIGDNQKAIELTKTALNIYEESEIAKKRIDYVCAALGTLGECYTAVGDFDKAEKYLQKGIKLGVGNKIAQVNLIGLYESLYKLKELQKDYKNALKYYQLHKNLHDSFYGGKTSSKIKEIESEKIISNDTIEQEKILNQKEAEKAELKNMYLRYIFLILCIIFIIIAVVFWHRRYQTAILAEKNQLILQNQLQALRTQMNPHFIFNTLNSVQNLILKSEKQKAQHYLTKFSDIIQLILVNSENSFIELQKELELINLYIKLQNLRFEDKIKYTLQINNDNLINKGFKIPGMILQPIIENAIIHGIMNRKDGGSIFLKIFKEDDYFIITVKDNGVGREYAEKMKHSPDGKHLSISTVNTNQRIGLLITAGYKESKYEIEDLLTYDSYPMGTKVTLKLPYSL